MDATVSIVSQDVVDRRGIGQHIGAVLRHARNACRLNLDGATVDAIKRELGHVIDCAGVVVWDRDGENDD